MFFFGCHALAQNCSVSFHPVVGMLSYHILPVVDRIFFRCFGMSCFVCIVLPFLDISLIFLISPVLSSLFPQVYWYFFLCSLFYVLFKHIPASFLCFIILVCFRWFLSAFRVEYPILVLIFLSCFLRGSLFSHKLMSLLHRLVRLILLYVSLMYKLVLYSFYSFPS